ncbi:MAG: AI-2E family transporter [Desulfuromonadales bacterium]|nr:MAG: AI-2E family transporter [Desulfuromonadales bacterium]
MDRGHFYALATFAFLALMLYLVYTVVSPFMAPLGWAGVIGVLTFPLYRRLRARLRTGDTVAASVMTPAVVVTLVVPVIALTLFLVKEATLAYGFLERVAADGGQAALQSLHDHPLLAPWVRRLEAYTGPLSLEIDTTVLPEVKEVAAKVLGYSRELIKNMFLFAIKLIMMVIALFFIYRDGERVQRHVLAIIPLSEGHKELLTETVRRVIGAVMFGVFLTCLVQGALGAAGFLVVGLPSPVLFGAIMSVCALIPVFGTGLIWLPAAVYLLLNGEVARGVGLMAWGFLVVSSIDNFIRPFFISGKAKLPVLVIAIGGLGGLAAFGLLGAVVGPIILALFLALFDMYRVEVEAGQGNSAPEPRVEV